MGGEGGTRRPQRPVKRAAVLVEHSRRPAVRARCVPARPVSDLGQRRELRQSGVEITAHLVHELHPGCDIGGLDVDVEERHVADPGFVFDLDGVVADADDQVGRAQEATLHLPARPLDATDGERVILVDHSLGHGRGGERQVMALYQPAQQAGIGEAHGRGADHRDRSLRRRDQIRGSGDRGVAGRCEAAHRHGRWWRPLLRRRERHVLRQIEMHRPLGFAECQRDRRAHGLGDAAFFQAERCLGDRSEQRMVVDPHLNAAAELIGIEIAGDGDHRRAVEIGAADAGREIGSAGSERRDGEAGPAGHPPGDIGGKPGRALMGREHEIDAALAHGLHQGKHVAARNTEAAVDAGRLQGGDDQVSIVHGAHILAASRSAI